MDFKIYPNSSDDFPAITFDAGSVSFAMSGSMAPPVHTPVANVAPPRKIDRLGFKRMLDLALVILAAPIIVVTVAILALLVALDSGKPFYCQDRVGRDGRIFRMWKLRSMVHNADEQLEAFLDENPDARNEWDLNQKLADDPRITLLGKKLRSSSLDELPQLWNVLIGDMSLVGPRPMMPSQRDLYPGDAYYRMLPGITGPWQVSERNKSTFADRATYDHHYEQSLSFTNDIRLLFKTISVVFSRTGC